MEWFDIPGFEGRYKINKVGQILSLEHTLWNGRCYRRIPEKVLSWRYTKNYAYIRLFYDTGKYKQCYIHRLVTETFIPNPENKPTVNHKDGNRYNNCVDNLEWATYSENIQHAFNTGLNKSTLGWKNPKANRWRPVEKCNLNGEVICKFDTLQDAVDDLQVPYKYIYKVCRGEISNTKGFKYRYCDHK